jgi:hypothetical protein
MEAFVESIYLEELVTQCAWSVSAVQRMNEILQAPGTTPQIFFRQAAALLQHAGLASKILWPPGSPVGFKNKRAKARAAHIRKMLAITDGHVLKNRQLRDHFEHYDERLDDWVTNSPNRIFVNNVIGPRTVIGGNVVKDHEIIKLYDPMTKCLIFRGEPFDIQSLVSGLIDIQQRAQHRLTQISNRVGGQ